jgi:hypothetical protein
MAHPSLRARRVLIYGDMKFTAMLGCLHAARLVFNELLGTGFPALNQG